jgi:chemotaxis signal transduction protein
MTWTLPARWLRFRIAGREFAVGLDRVAEVCEARTSHAIPFVPQSVGGVHNVRGEPLAAVDGARLLLGAASGRARTLVVLEQDGIRVGLRVDEVSRIEPEDRFELETDDRHPDGAAQGTALRWARAGDGARIGLCDGAVLLERARELFARPDLPPIQLEGEGGAECPHAS